MMFATNDSCSEVLAAGPPSSWFSSLCADLGCDLPSECLVMSDQHHTHQAPPAPKKTLPRRNSRFGVSVSGSSSSSKKGIDVSPRIPSARRRRPRRSQSLGTPCPTITTSATSAAESPVSGPSKRFPARTKSDETSSPSHRMSRWDTNEATTCSSVNNVPPVHQDVSESSIGSVSVKVSVSTTTTKRKLPGRTAVSAAPKMPARYPSSDCTDCSTSSAGSACSIASLRNNKDSVLTLTQSFSCKEAAAKPLTMPQRRTALEIIDMALDTTDDDDDDDHLQGMDDPSESIHSFVEVASTTIVAS